MSKRHHSQETVPPPRVELRAHAHNERHRINAALHEVAGIVSNGVAAEDVHEPGIEWRVEAHHDKDRAIKKQSGAGLRHWKTKEWKRRSVERKRRAIAFRAIAD
jgi:hypothetical protein